MKMKDGYVVDYDLPSGNGRRQFYRYLGRILKECHWKKSNKSVIPLDDLQVACAVVEVARAHNARYASMYKATPV